MSDAQTEGPMLLSFDDLRTEFGITQHRTNIYTLIKKKGFPMPVRCGGLTKFKRAEVQKWVENLKPAPIRLQKRK
jgi:predicted DNA-binding transcriptional regulator AlpA